MENVYFVDTNYEIKQNNPFDKNNTFNNEWVLLKLVDNSNINMIVGKGKSNVYEVTISKYCVGWEYRIIDFVKYHLENGYKIICSMDKFDYDSAIENYNNSNHFKLRSYEPKILVHSTLPQNIDMINKSGSLKSWNRLKQEEIISEDKPIGNLLGDPMHFSDYIMLGEGVSCEIVVLSKQLNKIEMNIDLPYNPGGRFYFDVSKLAQDGLLVRDGVHLKVKHELPLDKYLLCLITPKDLQFEEQEITPRIFTHLSDIYYKNNFSF